jgi:hypothetical protein
MKNRFAFMAVPLFWEEPGKIETVFPCLPVAACGLTRQRV